MYLSTYPVLTVMYSIFSAKVGRKVAYYTSPVDFAFHVTKLKYTRLERSENTKKLTNGIRVYGIFSCGSFTGIWKH